MASYHRLLCDPNAAMREQAARSWCDWEEAIVMATQGQSGLKRWYLGGVADAVLRTATKPVLLAPPAPGALAHRPVQFARIAAPLAGSALAEAALPIAEGLARPAHGQLILLHVQPAPATAGSGASPEGESTDAEANATARAYLASAHANLRDAAAATTVVLRGTPSDAIAQHLAGWRGAVAVTRSLAHPCAPAGLVAAVAVPIRRSAPPLGLTWAQSPIEQDGDRL